MSRNRVVSCVFGGAGAVACLLAILAWFAMATPESQAADDARQYPYKITCTTGMVADIVGQVAGENAEVKGIIGEGVDPHLSS